MGIGWSVAAGSRRCTRVSEAFANSVSSARTWLASVRAAASLSPERVSRRATCSTYAPRSESAAAPAFV